MVREAARAGPDGAIDIVGGAEAEPHSVLRIPCGGYVALLRLPLERYDVAHPAPEDVLLIVEVADTSLVGDRALKLPRYAVASIAEVWIVNVKEREVEVYRQPSGDRYAEIQRLRQGTVAPLAFPGEAIDIEEILGPGTERFAGLKGR